MSIENYKYLWDGTEDGWALQEINRTSWKLIFLFESVGPTMEQITKLRNLLPEFKGKASAQVLKILKGKSQFEPEAAFGNISIQKMKNLANAAGLSFKINAIECKSYLPTRNGNQVIVIENEELAFQIAQNMKKAGVKVVETYID